MKGSHCRNKRRVDSSMACRTANPEKYTLLCLQGNDYEHHVRQNVFNFMHEKLGVPKAEVIDTWKAAFVKYNQTLKGLRQSGFQFDTEEYWDYIRDGAEQFLSPDPQARSLVQ
jgi:hypothetical protein